MKKIRLFLLLITCVAVFFSCSDKSSNLSSSQPTGSAYQIPWCQPPANDRVSVWDSCFTYQFADDNLSLDFCLPDNCTHDSVRFVVRYEVSHDTIFVSAVDTATSNLRCPCNYIIHVGLERLPLEKYMVRCTHVHPDTSWIVYDQYVRRSGS